MGLKNFQTGMEVSLQTTIARVEQRLTWKFLMRFNGLYKITLLDLMKDDNLVLYEIFFVS